MYFLIDKYPRYTRRLTYREEIQSSNFFRRLRKEQDFMMKIRVNRTKNRDWVG